MDFPCVNDTERIKLHNHWIKHEKQLCQVFLCITKGLELVYNVVETILVGYLV